MSTDNNPIPEQLDENAEGVIVNEDGSITLAQSGTAAKGPAPVQWTGGDLKPDTRFGSLAISKFINCLMYDGKKSTAEKLAQELIDCYNKSGTTIQKRENTHRMAEANKAFSHFA